MTVRAQSNHHLATFFKHKTPATACPAETLALETFARFIGDGTAAACCNLQEIDAMISQSLFSFNDDTTQTQRFSSCTNLTSPPFPFLYPLSYNTFPMALVNVVNMVRE
jgi:hypothetical protein